MGSSNLESGLCVKPSHLTYGREVFFLENGQVSCPEPTGPGAREMSQLGESVENINQLVITLQTLIRTKVGA